MALPSPAEKLPEVIRVVGVDGCLSGWSVERMQEPGIGRLVPVLSLDHAVRIAHAADVAELAAVALAAGSLEEALVGVRNLRAAVRARRKHRAARGWSRNDCAGRSGSAGRNDCAGRSRNVATHGLRAEREERKGRRQREHRQQPLYVNCSGDYDGVADPGGVRSRRDGRTGMPAAPRMRASDQGLRA